MFESQSGEWAELHHKVKELQELLDFRGETLSLAESCTGGLLSALITAQAGVSSFFRGAVVTYHGDLKVDLLGVPRRLLLTHGEVSRPVAQFMAQSARDVMQSHWSLSATGIAGPSGGSKDKPVGTVAFAVVGPGVAEVQEQKFPGPQRQDIQRQAVLFALELLLRQIRV